MKVIGLAVSWKDGWRNIPIMLIDAGEGQKSRRKLLQLQSAALGDVP